MKLAGRRQARWPVGSVLVSLAPMLGALGMPAPLTSHQRNLFMAKRRSGGHLSAQCPPD